MRRVRLAIAVLLTTGVVAACDSGDPTSDPASQVSTSQSPAPPPPPSAADKLGLESGWGPSDKQLVKAAKQVRRMSLPDLAGQVIVASFVGTAAPVALVRRLHLGGVIAFSDNVATTGQVRGMTTALRKQISRPLIVSVDQEGGSVERVKDDATRFPAFMSAGAAGDPDLTEKAYAASGHELAGLGFNVDFAPVADVTSPGDPTIGARSAGDDPAAVGEQVVAAGRGFLDAGVMPVVKHFPGHGSVPADSHFTLPVQKRRLKQLRAVEFAPFEEAIAGGLPAVMVGHIDVRAVAPGVPSSISRKVVTGLLRRELGFSGVVFTDAMDMAGVATRYPSGRSAPLALAAGVDVVLMPPDPAAARAGIISAVRSGQLPGSRLRQAAARVLALLSYQRSRRARGLPPGGAGPVAGKLSARAITAASGPCSGRLVGSAVTPMGDSAAVSVFAAAAQRAGLPVLLRRPAPAELVTPAPRPAPPTRPVKPRQRKDRAEYRRKLRAYERDLASYEKRAAAWRRSERQRRSELRSWQSAENARLAAGTSIAFAGPGSRGYSADIVVATDSPYVLGRSAAQSKLATYGSTPGAMQALVEVLLGRRQAPGRLPVRVAGTRTGCG
ncbi:MAG: glycoside hydrolase family 3 protein [Nocardioides sp.]|jgi:beta-N-acetylhexosaminidase